MNQSATHTWILSLGLSLLLVGSGLAMLATPLLSSAELPSAGQRVAVRDAQFEEEPELPDPIIPIPENPEPQDPEPQDPEPKVPEPSVPEPNVPEPENPEPGAEGRYPPTLLEPAPQPRANRRLQIGPARTPAMI